MSYVRKTKTAYGREDKQRLRTRLYLLPEAQKHFATINGAMESINSLAPSRTLAITMGLELLALQAKRSPVAVAKRIRALSVSPARIEAGTSMLPVGKPVVQPAMVASFLNSLRLGAPPCDPGETCGYPAVEPESAAD